MINALTTAPKPRWKYIILFCVALCEYLLHKTTFFQPSAADIIISEVQEEQQRLAKPEYFQENDFSFPSKHQTAFLNLRVPLSSSSRREELMKHFGERRNMDSFCQICNMVLNPLQRKLETCENCFEKNTICYCKQDARINLNL